MIDFVEESLAVDEFARGGSALHEHAVLGQEHDEDDRDARKRSDDVVGGGRDRGKGVVFV